MRRQTITFATASFVLLLLAGGVLAYLNLTLAERGLEVRR